MENFLKELKELLDKHNMSICFDCSSCSDTHGIYDEGIQVESLGKDGEKFKFHYEWCITSTSIE